MSDRQAAEKIEGNYWKVESRKRCTKRVRKEAAVKLKFCETFLKGLISNTTKIENKFHDLIE